MGDDLKHWYVPSNKFKEIEKGDNKMGLLFTINGGKYFPIYSIKCVVVFFFLPFWFSSSLSRTSVTVLILFFFARFSKPIQNAKNKYIHTSRSLIKALFLLLTLQRNISSSEHELVYYHQHFRHSFPLIPQFQQSLEEYYSCCCPNNLCHLHLQSIHFHWVILIVL